MNWKLCSWPTGNLQLIVVTFYNLFLTGWIPRCSSYAIPLFLLRLSYNDPFKHINNNTVVISLNPMHLTLCRYAIVGFLNCSNWSVFSSVIQLYLLLFHLHSMGCFFNNFWRAYIILLPLLVNIFCLLACLTYNLYLYQINDIYSSLLFVALE